MYSEIILYVTWKMTEIFFFLSLFFLGAFFYVKIILSKRVNASYENFSFQKYKNIDNLSQFETILYANYIGQQMLSIKETNIKKLRYRVKQMKLSERIYSIYQSKSYSFNKIYLLPILATLRDKRFRDLFINIIEKSLGKQVKFEFVIWSLFGLALSSKNSRHIKHLYDLLLKLDRKYNPTQKFSQYFLSKSFLSVKRKEVIAFSKDLSEISISPVSYALIRAFKSVKYSEEIYKQVELYRKRYSYDVRLVLAVFELYSFWEIDMSKLVVEYFNHNNSDIRKACASCDLSKLNREARACLVQYLLDIDIEVRLKFIISVVIFEVEHDGLRQFIKDARLSVQEKLLLMQSIKEYKEQIPK